MPVDSSIYFQQQTPDILGNVQKGLSVRDMMQQSQIQKDQVAKQKAVDNAYASGVTTNPDGTTSFDQNKVLTGLAQAGAGQQAMTASTEFRQQQLAQQKAQREKAVADAGVIANIAPTMKDQPSYEAGLKFASQQGVDITKMPKAYDPGLINTIHQSAISAKDQSELDNKNKGLTIQQQEADAKTKIADDNHQDRIAKMGQAQSGKADDAYQKATHDLNSFRGNTAVQQASVALTNAKNAMSLADKGNLSPDQLHLFSSEMAKLATGGVPGAGEIQALMPNTMQTKLANITQFFANSPSDADAQAFINNNKVYLKELLNNYGGVVDTYKYNTLDGYKKKLMPDDYKELKGKIKAQSAVTENSSGGVQMRDPQGNIRIIPADQVDAAKAAGGKPI